MRRVERFLGNLLSRVEVDGWGHGVWQRTDTQLNQGKGPGGQLRVRQMQTEQAGEFRFQFTTHRNSRSDDS